jgi:Leucine-rich repeat (LRR) protein
MKPDFFANVSHLRELTLWRSEIYFLRKEMFYGLKHLEILSVWVAGINSFESVKEALSAPGLQYLDISGNKISGSPPENIFRGLQSTVTHLAFYENNFIEQLLYNLSEFAFLTELTSLDLSNNNIHNITTDRPLPNLVKLRLQGNIMQMFPQTCMTDNFSLFPSLKTFVLDANPIYTSCFYDVCLPQLTVLYLSRSTLGQTCAGVFSKFPSL